MQGTPGIAEFLSKAQVPLRPTFTLPSKWFQLHRAPYIREYVRSREFPCGYIETVATYHATMLPLSVDSTRPALRSSLFNVLVSASYFSRSPLASLPVQSHTIQSDETSGPATINYDRRDTKVWQSRHRNRSF